MLFGRLPVPPHADQEEGENGHNGHAGNRRARYYAYFRCARHAAVVVVATTTARIFGRARCGGNRLDVAIGCRRDCCQGRRRAGARRCRRQRRRGRAVRAVAGGQKVLLGDGEGCIAKRAGRRHGRVDGLEVGIVGFTDALGGRDDKVARVAAQAVVHGGDIVAVAARRVGRGIEARPRAGRVGVKVVGKGSAYGRRL